MLRERAVSLMRQFLISMKGKETFRQAKKALVSLETEAQKMDDKSFFAGVAMWFSAFTDVTMNLRLS